MSKIERRDVFRLMEDLYLSGDLTDEQLDRIVAIVANKPEPKTENYHITIQVDSPKAADEALSEILNSHGHSAKPHTTPLNEDD
jgi:hypothetical protein